MKRTSSALLVVFACLAAGPASAKIVFLDPAPTAPAVQPAPQSQVAAAPKKAPRPSARPERRVSRETPPWARRLEGAASKARSGR